MIIYNNAYKTLKKFNSFESNNQELYVSMYASEH